MRPISISNETEVYENKFLRLYSVKADFGKFEREYFVVDKGRRVGVLVLQDDQVLLVRQYRFVVNDMSWELPGGGVEATENFEQAATRECLEEAGVVCRSVSPVIEYHQGVDTTLCITSVFECSDFEMLDEFKNEETDDRQWFSYEQALDMALDGRIKDSMTITALLAHFRTNNRSS